MRRRLSVLAVALVIASLGSPSAEAATPANGCFRISVGPTFSEHFRLKAVDLDTYLLIDREGRLLARADGNEVTRVRDPAPAAEWVVRADRRHVRIGSGETGRSLTANQAGLKTVPGRGARFRLRRSRGCHGYPEAEVNARGRTPRRKLWGFADSHLHITANLRAGGNVISGRAFHRYGVAEALGHDADVHGADGLLDVTGNLLRSGSPVGTHDTDGWPTFAGWPVHDTLTHQQVYWRWLQRAWMGGLRLVVAQTVEDEPLCKIEPLRKQSCNETTAIEAQIAELHDLQDYIDAQYGGRGRGWFRLVDGPGEAERVIRAGKLAVVIGIESSDLFGCSELLGAPNCDRTRIDEGIARMRSLGVRSMFLAHWVDNALGGAALEGGSKGLFISAMQVAQTGVPFSAGACPDEGQGEEVLIAIPTDVSLGGRRCNTRGLTELGEYAVRRLMDAQMLIEVDHLGERGRDRVLAIAAERHYPVVSSHTGTGGAWTPRELRELYGSGGYASATLDSAASLPKKILGFRPYQGERPIGVGLGTDTGGFAELPGPEASRPPLAYPFRSFDRHVSFDRERTGSRTFDINSEGVAHYGLLPDLLALVQREPDGPRAMRTLFSSAAAYVQTWRRTGRG